MTSTNENVFVKIAVIDNIIEAQMIKSVLDEENIPYLLRSYHDTAYDGLFQFQKGYGEISAPKNLNRTYWKSFQTSRPPGKNLIIMFIKIFLRMNRIFKRRSNHVKNNR